MSSGDGPDIGRAQEKQQGSKAYVYGLKHTLTLVRKSDDDAIFRANAADAGKVTIDKNFLVYATRASSRRGKVFNL